VTDRSETSGGPPVLERSELGQLSRLGAGGEGVVYTAPRVRLSHVANAVYKEYRSRSLRTFDVQVLRSMTEFLVALSHSDGSRLINQAAWPCATVRKDSSIAGFVMPAVPDAFYLDWVLPSGKVDRALAEFQHLLNPDAYLTKRGLAVAPRERLELLSTLARALEFMHRHGIVIGDFSPKNVLFALDQGPSVFFIDCDAVCFQGHSATPQLETPGWAVPAGEALATIESDTFKFALLAVRTIEQDHGATRPSPGRARSELSGLLERALGAARQRPSLVELAEGLDRAAKSASSRRPAERPVTGAQTWPASSPPPSAPAAHAPAGPSRSLSPPTAATPPIAPVSHAPSLGPHNHAQATPGARGPTLKEIAVNAGTAAAVWAGYFIPLSLVTTIWAGYGDDGEQRYGDGLRELLLWSALFGVLIVTATALLGRRDAAGLAGRSPLYFSDETQDTARTGFIVGAVLAIGVFSLAGGPEPGLWFFGPAGAAAGFLMPAILGRA